MQWDEGTASLEEAGLFSPERTQSPQGSEGQDTHRHARK